MTHSERTQAFAQAALPVVEEAREQLVREGKRVTYRAIAQRLNRLGVSAYRGGAWHGVSVLRVLRSAEASTSTAQA